MRKLSVTLTQTEQYLGWIYAALQLLVLPAALNLLLPYIWPDISETCLNFIFFVLNFVCMALIMRRFLGEHAKIAWQKPFRTLRFAVGAYVFFWIGTIITRGITTYFMPEFSNVNDVSIMEMAASDYTLTAIGTVLLAPLTEELIYRGLFFDGLHHRSPALAFIVSTFVFSAIHVVGYIGLYDPLTLVLCFAQYIPAGLCLGWAYTRSGTIWAPILAHMAINQTSILAMR